MLGLSDKIKELQASGERVIDLSLGQPEVPPPLHVIRALRVSLRDPQTGYASSEGSFKLRSLLAEGFAKSGAPTQPSDVIVTAGSKHALFISLLSLLDPGDEILVPEPFFPPYKEISALIGARLRTFPVNLDEIDHFHFTLDVEAFLSSISRRTRVVLLNYPNNPAGWTLDRAQVRKIADHCSKNEIFLVSDEIYDKIVFDGREHIPAWSFSKGSEYIVTIGSFSKTYCMVPYRLGYVLARGSVKENILKSMRASITFVSPHIQSAGIAALEGPQDFVKMRLMLYQKRRNYCLRVLQDHGINAPFPEGAFYLFVPLLKNHDATEFCMKLLAEKGVATLPGKIFGERWKRFVRLSMAVKDQQLKQGIKRFAFKLSQLE